MKTITLINTGGTFNKIYNPISGELEINTSALIKLQEAWQCTFDVINIINKDSLAFTNDDRALLLKTVQSLNTDKCIVIHGTDTMEDCARYLDKSLKDFTVVFTGAMVPFSINPIEASANLGLALGFLQANSQHGIYIAMHGLAKHHSAITKDKKEGLFKRKV